MFYEWSDELSVGVASIDKQHKVLIGLVNELHDAIESGQGGSVSKSILKKVINYAQSHFIYEESLFESCEYELTDTHKRSHENIKSKLAELEVQSRDPDYVLDQALMDFLKNWLNNHILKEDMGYSKILISNNIE